MEKQTIISAIEAIMSADTLNKWYSVRERPLNKILAKYGINKDAWSLFHQILSRNNLMETEGQNGFMRYKITTDFVPDYDALATEIKKAFEDKRERQQLEYKRRKAQGDYRPGGKCSKSSTDKFFNRSGKAVHISKAVELPHLGDARWFMNDDYITEGRVTGLFIDRQTVTSAKEDVPEYKTKIIVRLEYKNTNDPKAEVRPFKEVELKTTFPTIEKLIENLQRKAVKY